MNKILNVNSFFTKIILAVLSFAVIVCIFIPYLRIPAVDSVKDVDIKNFTLDRKIGKNQSTFKFLCTIILQKLLIPKGTYLELDCPSAILGPPLSFVCMHVKLLQSCPTL